MLLLAREIINNILVDANLEIIDIFEYGKSKFEFMIRRNDEIISISVVDDGAYDFMVFNSDGDKIIYSNTEKLISLNSLKEILCHDLGYN